MPSYALQFGRMPRRTPKAADIRRAANSGTVNTLLVEPGHVAGLRLNSDDGRRYAPDRLAEVPDNAAKLAALKEEIARDVDMFARNRHRMLDLYFEFVAASVAAAAAELDARLAWAGGLFGAEDFAFSAWRPLPNAFIVAAPPGDGDTPPLACDYAFWTGARLIALSVRTVAAAAPAQSGDGVLRRIDLPAADLEEGCGVFAPARFPPDLLAFWEGETVPSSPFRPQGLAEGVGPT